MSEPIETPIPTTLDFTGYAQEFLRRNQRYQADYVELRERIEQNPASLTCREMAHKWGLMFPMRSR